MEASLKYILSGCYVTEAFNCTSCVQEIKSCEGSEGVPVGCSSIQLYHLCPGDQEL